MRGDYHYLWLSDPWRDLLQQSAQRQWSVAGLNDFDFGLRDGYALHLVRRCLAGRPDVRYAYARAYGISPPADPPAPGRDTLLVGRPKPYLGSPLSYVAKCLEGRMCGTFIDPGPGLTANSIIYDGRQYTRREIAGSTREWRRYDRDYAVLVYREVDVAGEVRRLAALAGLGSLGTLLLTASLADAPMRSMLAQQARRMAPLRSDTHRPNVWVEVLVGFELRQHSYLETLLPRLDDVLYHQSGQSLSDTFEARVEVVAVSTVGGGKAVFFNDAPDKVLELRPLGGGRSGGQLRLVDGLEVREVRLTCLRTIILRAFAEASRHLAMDALRSYIVQNRPPGTEFADNDCARRRVIFDINELLEELVGSRPIRWDHKQHAYVCRDVHLIWNPQPAS